MLEAYQQRLPPLTSILQECPRCCSWPTCQYHNEVVLDTKSLYGSTLAAWSLLAHKHIWAVFYVSEKRALRSVAYEMSRRTARNVSEELRVPLVEMDLFARRGSNFITPTFAELPELSF